MKFQSIVARNLKSLTQRWKRMDAAQSQLPPPRKPHDDILREALVAAPEGWLTAYFQRRIQRAFSP